jgi:hypothetical protein
VLVPHFVRGYAEGSQKACQRACNSLQEMAGTGASYKTPPTPYRKGSWSTFQHQAKKKKQEEKLFGFLIFFFEADFFFERWRSWLWEKKEKK